nr:MAG TPA_asm: hypothetical protein [Caudoviricetes sp.]
MLLTHCFSFVKRILCRQISVWASHNCSSFKWRIIIKNNTRCMLSPLIYKTVNRLDDFKKTRILVKLIYQCRDRSSTLFLITINGIMN